MGKKIIKDLKRRKRPTSAKFDLAGSTDNAFYMKPHEGGEDQKSKVSKHYLDYKFTPKETIKQHQNQIDLFSDPGQDSLEPIENNGGLMLSDGGYIEYLDLTINEERVMHGIFNLLTQTNYKGQKSEHKKISNFKYEGPIPILETTKTNFYKACMLQPKETPRGKMEYTGKEPNNIYLALEKIAQTNYPIFYRVPIRNNHGDPIKGKFDLIKTFAPLIKLSLCYEDNTEADIREILKGNFQIAGKKLQKISIRPSPLLINEINTYFVEINPALYLECKTAHKSKGWRQSKYPMLFIEWLHTQSYHKPKNHKVEINYIKLSKKINLDPYIKSRQHTRLKGILRKCYIIAQELGYLTKWESGVRAMRGEKEVFVLNPEAFTRMEKDNK